VTYRYYPGHFMQAVATAFKFMHNEEARNVLLVIDEINRGNSAAIFGTAFQLLDRNEDGWSSYSVNISEMEKISLLKEMGAVSVLYKAGGVERVTWKMDEKDIFDFPVNGQIKLPPNLYIVATMNTSDESIYYMDSAFKRRWSWEYVPIDGVHTPYAGTLTDAEWRAFVGKLNAFIRSHAAVIRKVEDKQIGYFFIKSRNGEINKSDIQNKLMFFLWDTVFSRDKRPLKALLNEELVTFGDFSTKASEFFATINAL
jgi:5-methylcytosine-specific restriction protein B